MLFNSYEFIFIFLPIVWILYFYFNNIKYSEIGKSFLIFASLFFYSWWNIKYLPIILISMFFNYIVGKTLSKNGNKSLLVFGIVVNLSLLGYFKYADFFIENINNLTKSNINFLHLALPLAISFFTFQQISYLVDSYKQETKEYDFLNYALFVTFFPQLIAGPIVHHKEMMPQFAKKDNKIKNYENITKGIFIFSMGLFKKVVIADTFATWATNGFDVAKTLNLAEAWITSLSYTFQLYFDFSGYTDMAIGAALLFNIKLPINFDSPYKATTIQSFWRRWHMTLSRFLKDYIYIPLGGSHKSRFNTYTNLMVTFLLAGLWHGAGWTFVFWGFLHGVALVIHRIWKDLGLKMNKILAWFITFNFINITWIFFRAKSWDDAIKVLDSMFSLNNIMLPGSLENKLVILKSYGVTFGFWLNNILGNSWTTIWLILSFITILFIKNSNEQLEKFTLNKKTALQTAFMFSLSILSFSKLSEFLYFNF